MENWQYLFETFATEIGSQGMMVDTVNGQPGLPQNPRELGDGMDVVEWSVFYEMVQAIVERVEALGAPSP